LAAFGAAAGAFAQGSVNLDNSQSTGRLVLIDPGNDYGGIYGIEDWELNASAVPRGINGAGTAGAAYAELAASGFKLVATYADQNNNSTPGVVQLGQLKMPQVTPAGANVVLALVAWDSAASTFDSAEAEGTAIGGILAFVNPTANYTAIPTPASPGLSGWTSDLILAVPEPSCLALAAVGGAVLLVFRRRVQFQTG
jgi:hypothetical protein